MTEPGDTYTVAHEGSISIAGTTLPWATVLVRMESPAQNQEIFARADADGAFAVPIQLAEDNNAITIIAFHTTSDEEKKEHRVVDYDPNPTQLYVTVTEPDNEAVVDAPLLAITGKTLPDAQVTVNKIIPGQVSKDGEWQAMIVLQPDVNEIVVAASRNGQRRTAIITVTYTPQ